MFSGVKVNADLIGQIEVLSKLIVNTNFTEPIYNAFTEILSGRISLNKIENLVSVYQLGLDSEVRLTEWKLVLKKCSMLNVHLEFPTYRVPQIMKTIFDFAMLAPSLLKVNEHGLNEHTRLTN